MSDERADVPTGSADAVDILDEIKAEVAQELAEDRPPAGGPAYQVVGALVALVVGTLGALLAWRYGLGTMRRPGPGLWPFVVSAVIAVLAAVLLIAGCGLQDSEKFTRASWLPIIGTLTFFGLGWAMPRLGFEIPALLLCVVWLRWLGGETWRSTVVVSVLTVAAFYLLFIHGLRIPVPHII